MNQIKTIGFGGHSPGTAAPAYMAALHCTPSSFCAGSLPASSIIAERCAGLLPACVGRHSNSALAIGKLRTSDIVRNRTPHRLLSALFNCPPTQKKAKRKNLACLFFSPRTHSIRYIYSTLLLFRFFLRIGFRQFYFLIFKAATISQLKTKN